jgi:hypothetical protein
VNETPLQVIATFKELLAALRAARCNFAFIGAIPVLAWGRVRATTDLDLVVETTPEAFRALDAEFRRRGWTPGKAVGPADRSDELPDMLAFWTGASPPVRIDVFIAKLEFERQVIARARSSTIFGERVPVAEPEASIVYKLLASRGRDLDDVNSIFENRRAAGEALDWDFLDHWASEWEITDRLAPYRAKYGPPKKRPARRASRRKG